MRNLRTGLILSALGAILAGNAQADTITYLDGRRPTSNVEVRDEKLDKIEYKDPRIRQLQSVDTGLVADIQYSKTPELYDTAMEALAVSAFVDAAKMFKAAVPDIRNRDGLKARCLYEAGDAYRRAGMYKEAIQTFDDLIAQQPDSRYVPMAQLQRGRTLARSGDTARAKSAFSKLRSYGDRWQHESELQLLILDEASDPAAALENYRRLASKTANDYPSVSNQAKLRIGRSMIASGKYDEAIQFFETILDSRAASSREVVAGAYNGLGAALLGRGSSEEDFRRALYSHLRVVVSYGDVIEEQPEALYGAGKSFQRVEGPESLMRSKVMLRRCIEEYPNSKWALEAQKG